jgi:sodium/pantothenate symporter
MSWGVVFAVSPWQSSRHLMARNEHVVLRAAIVACLAVAVIQIMIYASAVTVNLSNPNISPPEQTMIWAAKNLLPKFLGAVLLAGIMAAALSSASTFLSLVGFSANNDIVRSSETDESKLFRFSRPMMLLVGAVALLISLFFPPSLFWLTYFVGTVFASSWGPVAFMSVWSRRITADGAFWGITSGFVFNVVPKFFEFIGWIELPSYLDPLLIGAVVSYAVVVLVSRCGTVTREERLYRMRLHRTPPGDQDAGLTKITMLAPLMLITAGILMPVLFINWHVRPYQAATGALINGESLDWLTGEIFLALAWGVWLIPMGLLAIWVIRRSYERHLIFYNHIVRSMICIRYA